MLESLIFVKYRIIFVFRQNKKYLFLLLHFFLNLNLASDNYFKTYSLINCLLCSPLLFSLILFINVNLLLFRSQAESVSQDRDQTLQNVLHFISEQEQYCRRREEGGKEELCESNTDSGIASKSSDLSSSEDIIRYQCLLH